MVEMQAYMLRPLEAKIFFGYLGWTAAFKLDPLQARRFNQGEKSWSTTARITGSIIGR